MTGMARTSFWERCNRFFKCLARLLGQAHPPGGIDQVDGYEWGQPDLHLLPDTSAPLALQPLRLGLAPRLWALIWDRVEASKGPRGSEGSVHHTLPHVSGPGHRMPTGNGVRSDATQRERFCVHVRLSRLGALSKGVLFMKMAHEELWAMTRSSCAVLVGPLSFPPPRPLFVASGLCCGR